MTIEAAAGGAEKGQGRRFLPPPHPQPPSKTYQISNGARQNDRGQQTMEYDAASWLKSDRHSATNQTKTKGAACRPRPGGLSSHEMSEGLLSVSMGLCSTANTDRSSEDNGFR
jgi:hypothetical protein